jgi:hypothetical protein
MTAYMEELRSVFAAAHVPLPAFPAPIAESLEF